MSKRTEYIKLLSTLATTLLVHPEWNSVEDAVDSAHSIIRAAVAKTKTLKFDDEEEVLSEKAG